MVEDVQVLLHSDANPVQIRQLRVSCYGHNNINYSWLKLKYRRVELVEITISYITQSPCPAHSAPTQSEHMARLVKVPGIVIQASGVKAKATKITIQCRSCRNFQSGISINPGLEGYSLPRRCPT